MKRALTLLAVGLMLALPATAMAQADGYNNVAGTNTGSTPSAPAATTGETQQVAAVSADSGGEALPFTGLEVGVILALGASLLAAGLLLRRVRTS